MYKLGEQIAQARKSAKITQEKLADELKLTRQAISSWECNKSQPDIDMVINLSRILNYRFMIDEGIYIGIMTENEAADGTLDHDSESGMNTATQPVRKKKFVPWIISFIAGILATLLIMLCIIPAFHTDKKPGYSIAKNEGGKTGPETVHWFREAEAPLKGKPYVVISFSENPIYARENSDFVDGVGWKYTVYLTEYNGHDFYPESYTMYYFRDEDTSVTSSYTAQDLEAWWGESIIPARRQQCVSSGDPLQNIIGIGIKLSGKDANGESMEFYGYMECSQEIKE